VSDDSTFVRLPAELEAAFDAAATDWTRVFLVPCAVTALCAAAYAASVRDPAPQAATLSE